MRKSQRPDQKSFGYQFLINSVFDCFEAQVLIPEMKSGLLRDQEYQLQVANQVTRDMLANQVLILSIFLLNFIHT